FFHARARFTLWYTFGLAMLAGAGWDALAARADASARSGILVVVCGLGLGIAAAVLGVSGGQPEMSPAVGSVLSGAAWLVVTGLLLAGKNRIPIRWWTAGALTLLYFDLFNFGVPLNPTTDARLYRRDAVERFSTGDQELDRTFTTEATYRVAVDRYFSFKGPFITDWQALTEMRTAVTPGLAAAERIFEVYNFDPIRVRRTTRLQETAEASGLPPALLNAMNVGYLPAFQAPAGTAALIPAGPPMVNRRDLSVPRAYVVQSTVRVRSLEEALAVMTAPGYDPAVTAVVESSIDFPAWNRAPGNARVAEYAPQRVLVEVESSGGLLVLSDAYYPGWVARVEGRIMPIVPANAAFRGVPVPPGRVRVEFSYEPESVRLGISITVVALAVLGILSGLVFLKPRRPS
ncbi:MAG: YfhO family protein, partial [Chloroflexota bacterium]